jgi:signal transduction histidine kinase
LAGRAAELAQQVFVSAVPQLAPDLSVDESPASAEGDDVPGRALLLPLSAEGVARGVLLLGRLAGPAPTLDQIEMVQGYVNQVALALALAETQQDRRMLAVYADRDRIARDLHDHVIQRLFASGLSLQGVSLSLPPEPAAKLERVVQGIDDTIRDLRRTIFSLRSPAIDAGTFRVRVLDVLGQAASALPHEPRLQLDGPLDSAVPGDVADDALAVLREGVSNAARHAAPTSVEISVTVNPAKALTITITDDGRGMPAPLTRSSGLTNCRARADSHGGTFEIRPGPDGRGTQLFWSVPVP